MSCELYKLSVPNRINYPSSQTGFSLFSLFTSMTRTTIQDRNLSNPRFFLTYPKLPSHGNVYFLNVSGVSPLLLTAIASVLKFGQSTHALSRVTHSQTKLGLEPNPVLQHGIHWNPAEGCKRLQIVRCALDTLCFTYIVSMVVEAKFSRAKQLKVGSLGVRLSGFDTLSPLKVNLVKLVNFSMLQFPNLQNVNNIPSLLF